MKTNPTHAEVISDPHTPVNSVFNTDYGLSKLADKAEQLPNDASGIPIKTAIRDLSDMSTKARETVNAIEADTMLNSDAKEYLKGKALKSHMAQFQERHETLMKHLEDRRDGLTNNLYTSNIELSDLDKAMMPYIMPKIEEGDTAYLRSVPNADMIANAMLRFGMLPKGVERSVRDYLNDKHTPDTQQRIDDTEQMIESAASGYESEMRIYGMRMPSEEKMEELEASASLKKFMNKMGVRF